MIKVWFNLVMILTAISVTTKAVAFDGGCNPDAPLETQISDCTEILENPSSDTNDLVIAHFTRGLAFRDLGNKKAAIEDFDLAVAIRPEDPQLREYRGSLMLGFGEYVAAVADFDWIVDRYPDAYGVLTSRCYARTELGNHWGAIEDCEDALRINPNLAGAYNNMALALFRIGALQNALNDVDVALSADSENWAVLDTKAHILAAVGKRQEATWQFLKVIELGGPMATKLYQNALQERGYYDGALDGQLTEALRVAISNCVEDGCGPLADAGVLSAEVPLENDNVKSQVFDPTYLCLAQAGLAEDSVFVSSETTKTLTAPDGSAVTVVVDSSGKQGVLARDARGLFSPDVTDQARTAVANCE